jgi:hypothetical protein
MPDTVYVIGAGASYGESLVPLPTCLQAIRNCTIISRL